MLRRSQIDKVMEIINGLDRHGRLNQSDVTLVSNILKSQVVISKNKINPLVSNYKDSLEITQAEALEREAQKEILRSRKLDQDDY